MLALKELVTRVPVVEEHVSLVQGLPSNKNPHRSQSTGALILRGY
jgi:hypothetical protein